MNSGADISQDDIVDYQRHLKGYLLDKVPEADLVEGSFLNDVVIKSMAYVVALFDKEAKSIKSRLSAENLDNGIHNIDFDASRHQMYARHHMRFLR